MNQQGSQLFIGPAVHDLTQNRDLSAFVWISYIKYHEIVWTQDKSNNIFSGWMFSCLLFLLTTDQRLLAFQHRSTSQCQNVCCYSAQGSFRLKLKIAEDGSRVRGRELHLQRNSDWISETHKSVQSNKGLCMLWMWSMITFVPLRLDLSVNNAELQLLCTQIFSQWGNTQIFWLVVIFAGPLSCLMERVTGCVTAPPASGFPPRSTSWPKISS